MRYVRELIEGKGRKVWSIQPDATVLDALKLMADKDIGALLVLDGEQVAGIFSERDYARKIILRGRLSKDTPVKDIMSTSVLYVSPEQSIEDCMALMTQKRIRHLPVMDSKKLVGLVSIGDVVNAIISTKGYEIKQLEHYITGLLHGV